MLSTHFVAESEPQCIFGATLQSCLGLGLWRAQQEGGQFWDVAGMKYDGCASHLGPVKTQGSSGHAQRHYKCCVGWLLKSQVRAMELKFC